MADDTPPPLPQGYALAPDVSPPPLPPGYALSGGSGQQPEERSVLKDVAFQVPQGINSGFDALYNAPNNAVNYVARQLGYEPPITPVKIGEAINDRYGIGEPTTTAGRYAHAVGEQIGANVLPTVGTIARGASAVPAVVNALSSSAGSGVASEAAKDAGLGPGWQLAAGLAGGAVAPNAVNSLAYKGPPDPRMVEKTLAAEAAQQEGIDVPRAAVGGSVEKPVAGRLASLPIVGAPINNAARTALDQTQDRLGQIADAYGTGSRATAGTNLRNSLVDYIDTGSRDALRPLWQNVYRNIDEDMLHQLPATQQAAQALRTVPSATMRNVNERALAPIEEDLAQASAQGGGLTYRGISQMRTVVGNMLDDRLAPNYGTMEPSLRRMYATLTQDLRGAAENAGGQRALQSFDRANTAENAIQDRTAALQKIVGRSGDNSGENVFDSMIQMAQNKGKSADLSRLALARRSVDPETWGDTSSAVIRRMGIDQKTGDFSPDRFLTSYGNLSPQGRNILFRGNGEANDLAQSLDRLSQVSRQFSELYKMGNPSGTGGATFISSLMGGGTVGGLINPLVWAGSASTLGGMWGASKWFAQPANVDKMTRTLAARMAYTRNPNPTTLERFNQASATLSNSLQGSQNALAPKGQ